VVRLSPRRRRRLSWAAGALAVVATIAVVVAVVPGRAPKSGAPRGDEGPAQVAPTTSYHLTAADRRAIDRTLDRFVPAAMARGDLAAAWRLAGPEMRSGSTLAGWRAGNTPVPYVVPRETAFHDWQTIDVGERYVVFNLLVHPRDRRIASSIVYAGEMVKTKRRWLVNRLYTIAIMKHPARTGLHEVGPADFAAPPAGSGRQTGSALLGGVWILPVVVILALVLALPVAAATIAVVRARRWRRTARARNLTPLPPLPAARAGAQADRPPSAQDD
jgi:hypothetical protein